MRIENVRVNYVSLATPKAFATKPGQPAKPPKYGVVVIIPKNHPQVAEIKAAKDAALAAKWPDPAKRPGGLWNPLQNGDDTDLFKIEEYRGSVIINARNDRAVPVVDANVVPLDKSRYDENGEWGSGDFANVFVEFYAFDNVQRGVACSLQGVQFVKHGERMAGSRKAVDEMFTKTAGDTAPAASTDNLFD
jgi:Protein of unknown function (DUF2815)